jgi:hypothetical protein
VGHHPHDAAAKCAGLADAYRDVAAALACPFFDAGAVVSARRVDSVHLDADQHAILEAPRRVVKRMRRRGMAPHADAVGGMA